MGISREQALDCFNSDDLIGIGMEADAIRRELHPEGVVSYAIDRKIDCASASFDAVCELIRETVEIGGSGVTLRGTADSDKKIEWYEQLFSGLREQFPAVWLHGLSASEILTVAEGSGLTIRDTISRLRDAGLGSISEILEGDPPHLPRGCIAQAWGVAEVLRVWRWLENMPSAAGV